MSRVKIEDLAVQRVLPPAESASVTGAGNPFGTRGAASQANPWGSPYYRQNDWQQSGPFGPWQDSGRFEYVPGYYFQSENHVHYEPGYWNYYQNPLWRPPH